MSLIVVDIELAKKNVVIELGVFKGTRSSKNLKTIQKISTNTSYILVYQPFGQN